MALFDSTNPDAIHFNSHMNYIIFCVLVLLALIGVIITDISPAIAHAYWVFMLVIYAIIAIVKESLQILEVELPLWLNKFCTGRGH